MSGHNDAIDRALERLEQDFKANCCDGSFEGHQMINVEAVREWIKEQPVLTDLAAEHEDRRLEAVAMSEQLDQERKDLEARLAAVEAEVRGAADYALNWLHSTRPGRETGGLVVHNLHERLRIALARGEGGEQADSTGEPAAETSREPATPDAAQITMHAYAPPLSPDLRRIYGGPCSHCGREPEHPCHGNASRDDVTKPQQSPASDGGLDEIVRAACEELGVEKAWPAWDAHLNVIAAACLRARETDPRLAAVRAWADDQAQEYHADLERLDAILDGREDDHE